MSNDLTWATLVAFAFALAGFLVGFFYQALSATLPIPGASQVLILAYECYVIGLIALVIATVLLVLKMRNGFG